jgi:AraC-like DNA-binding protein
VRGGQLADTGPLRIGVIGDPGLQALPRALADVAAEVGFADQAHLTRRFTSFLGVTPGEFARGRRHTV